MEKGWDIYALGFIVGFMTSCILNKVYTTMKRLQNETIRPMEEGPYCIYCHK
jgi:hypothetical protein